MMAIKDYIPHLLAKHPQDVRKATMIAILYKRNKIISVGFNRRRFHDSISDRWTYHAEEESIKKAGIRAKGSGLFVARIKRDGTLGLAKPCESCNVLIRQAEIAKVSYTE